MKKLRQLISALLLLFIGTAFAQQTVPDDEEDIYFILMGQADEAIKEQNYEEAVARLIEAMSIRPDSESNVLILSNLGMVYGLMDKDSLAIATLDHALELSPRMTRLIANRAKINLKTGNDIEAYKDFSRIIELDSLNATARYYHGIMALYAGEPDTAKVDFDVLESLYPDGVETLTAMSAYHSLLRNDREAIKYYKRLIEKDPAPEYYASLAGCYLATDQLGEASDLLGKAIEMYPKDPELYYYRAWLNKERYRFDDAKADGIKAIQLGASPQKVKELLTRQQ